MFEHPPFRGISVREDPIKVGLWIFSKFTVGPLLNSHLTSTCWVGGPWGFHMLMGFKILLRGSKNFDCGFICMNLATFGWRQSAGCMGNFPRSTWVKIFLHMTESWKLDGKTRVTFNCVTTFMFTKFPTDDMRTWNNQQSLACLVNPNSRRWWLVLIKKWHVSNEKISTSSHQKIPSETNNSSNHQWVYPQSCPSTVLWQESWTWTNPRIV